MWGMGGVVVVALIVGGFMLFGDRTEPIAVDAAGEAATSTAATAEDGSVVNVDAETGIITTSGTGGYSVSAIPDSVQAGTPAPDHKKPLVLNSGLSAVERTSLQNSYAKAQADITANALDFNAWISLGTINYMAGNYETARAIWEYGSTVWPTNYVTYNNLGNLFMSYLNDFPRAETNFLKAIEYKRDDTNPYRQLFTIYSETSYKPSNTAAEDILKKAIAAVPRAVDMQVLLARYYAELGRESEAAAMYQAAIANAESQGLTSLAASIRTEM
jgi:cytochrome c-type biogenesis protein CcmH/NrfG